MPKILSSKEYDDLMKQLQESRTANAVAQEELEKIKRERDDTKKQLENANMEKAAIQNELESTQEQLRSTEKKLAAAEKIAYNALSDFEKAEKDGDPQNPYSWLTDKSAPAIRGVNIYYQKTNLQTGVVGQLIYEYFCFCRGPMDVEPIFCVHPETNQPYVYRNIDELTRDFTSMGYIIKDVAQIAWPGVQELSDFKGLEEGSSRHHPKFKGMPVVSTGQTTNAVKFNPERIDTVPDYMFTSGAILDVLAGIKDSYKADGLVSDEELEAWGKIVKGCEEKVKAIANNLEKELKNYKTLSGETDSFPHRKEKAYLESVEETLGKM